MKCLSCGLPAERPVCDVCVGKAVDSMTAEDLLKAAKMGMVALVDEATGYQRVRAKDNLYQVYLKYL